MKKSDDVTTVSEHRSHLEAHLQLVRESGRPMFVTTNGETVAVVLSPDKFDELVEQAEHAKALIMVEQSIEDIKAGRTQLAKDAIDELAQEFGLTIERRPARN